MKMLRRLIMPTLLIILIVGLLSTQQRPVDTCPKIYTSSVSELAEFNASETGNIVHGESDNIESSLLDAVIEDKGIPLLDIVIEDSSISLLDIVRNDDVSLFSYSADNN